MWCRPRPDCRATADEDPSDRPIPRTASRVDHRVTEYVEPRLVRIEITAQDMKTAEEAAERIAGLWLASTVGPRAVPGQGVTATVHADLDRTPEDGGFADAGPVCPEGWFPS